MSEGIHELAPHHVPGFLPSADGSDPLMTVTIVFLVGLVILLGNFYLYLHSLPERMSHKQGHIQFEVVAILCLLALFTHNQIFWVAALLLAFVTIPDFRTPIESIAGSLGKLAEGQSRSGVGERASKSETPPEPEEIDPASSERETDDEKFAETSTGSKAV
ncbi:hypothetical protein [Roseibium sp. M-1]